MPRTLLLVHADPLAARTLQALLANSRDGPFKVEWATTCQDGITRLLTPHADPVAAIVADLDLPDCKGLDTFERLSRASPTTPLLVFCRPRDEDLAREAVHRGAQDYLLSEHLDGDALSKALCNMLERADRSGTLLRTAELASVTLRSIGDGVLTADAAGLITYLNPMAEKMTGWALHEACGRPLAQVLRIIDADTREPVSNPMLLAMRSDAAVGLAANCMLVRRDGQESAIEDTATPIHDAAGRVTGAVIVFHDVGMARALSLKMSYAAKHDPLTGLPNRLLFQDRLAHSIACASRDQNALAVLFVDVDRFKAFNDALGHAVGDEVLQAVAKQLVACTRRSDTVSRRGGDEFVVLLSQISCAQDAVLVAEQIVGTMELPHHIDDQEVNVTVSIGVGCYPDDANDIDALLECADVALSLAKAEGRGGYKVFRPGMQRRAVPPRVPNPSLPRRRGGPSARTGSLANQRPVD